MPRTTRALVLLAVLALGGCGGDDASSRRAAAGASGGGDGKAVFARAGCAGCHTLRDAGATGTVGPNLDEMKPNARKVEVFVTNGAPPVMPAFEGKLSQDEIEAVAAYVAAATGAEE